jgi:hypothetical protein
MITCGWLQRGESESRTFVSFGIYHSECCLMDHRALDSVCRADRVSLGDRHVLPLAYGRKMGSSSDPSQESDVERGLARSPSPKLAQTLGIQVDRQSERGIRPQAMQEMWTML